jgi:hypothetical protein
LQNLFPGREVILVSIGQEDGARASIRISGREYAPDQEGMNVVVVDASAAVIIQTAFDTGK